jgi:hypothetical protein
MVSAHERTVKLHNAGDEHLFRSAKDRLRRDARRDGLSFQEPCRELSTVERPKICIGGSLIPPAVVRLANAKGELLAIYLLVQGRWWRITQADLERYQQQAAAPGLI